MEHSPGKEKMFYDDLWFFITGGKYVSDRGNQRIEKFGDTGNFIREWGSLGAGQGQFNFPDSLAVDSAANVYVGDRDNHRIQKFSSSGNFIREWGKFGQADGEFETPFDVAIDTSGNVFVADRGTERIQKFTSSGLFSGHGEHLVQETDNLIISMELL
jgi:DNA-binding beta-propeller fold protein YncE